MAMSWKRKKKISKRNVAGKQKSEPEVKAVISPVKDLPTIEEARDPAPALTSEKKKFDPYTLPGAPKPADVFMVLENRRYFGFKLKNHKKIMIRKPWEKPTR